MDSVHRLIDKIDTIKNKISDNEYLELCKETQNLYNVLKESKSIESIIQERHLELSEIANQELDNEDYDSDTEYDSDAESESDEEVGVMDNLDNGCICNEHEFRCFNDPFENCNNYSIIVQHCPPFAIKFDENAEKYKLPKYIVEIPETSSNAIKCVKYILNSFRIHNKTRSERINGVIMCILTTILHYSPEYNNKRYLEVMITKLTECITEIEIMMESNDFNDMCKPILEDHYDSSAEETVEIIKGWKDQIQQKLAILELMSIEN